MDESLTAELLRMDLAVPFVIISLGFLVLVTALKRVLKIFEKTSWLDVTGAALVLEVSQPVLGGLLGASPGVFPEDLSLTLRICLGLVAGFASPMIYKHVLKKIAPDLAMGSEHEERSGLNDPIEP